ncbi:MAG: XdhC family protein [Candidatus Ventricola sp.]
MTLLSGDQAGAKCLISGQRIVWADDSFFANHAGEALAVSASGCAEIAGHRVFAELLGHEKRFVICGAGHISMPLISMIRMLDCPVTVIDDRPYFADNARRAQATTVFCEPFDDALSRIPGDTDTFFIIVTRGHRYDEACLSAIVRKPHAYIGMIGSRRRVGIVKQSVIEGGGDPDVVGSVHTPIGLSIGAQTPEEIAIAIMAEIIQVKNAAKRTGGYPREIMRALSGENAAQTPAVLATIVSRKGSAPRDIGTKMLIWPDGHTVGTIGGGCVEADVIRQARMMLTGSGLPSARLLEVDMTAEASEDEGMVCGGIIEVLLERASA